MHNTWFLLEAFPVRGHRFDEHPQTSVRRCLSTVALPLQGQGLRVQGMLCMEEDLEEGGGGLPTPGRVGCILWHQQEPHQSDGVWRGKRIGWSRSSGCPAPVS